MLILKTRDMTIKHKLTAIIMLISVTSLILGLVAFIVWEYFDLKKDMVTKLSTHAAIIADNAKAAVQFENAEDAGNVLRALQAEPSIVHARICTKDGNDLASYNINLNDKSIHLISITGGDYSFTHNSLNLKKDIILDKEKIGTIYIESNLDDLNSGITRTAGIGALIALIVIIVAYFLSAKLQKIISSPILKLASVANMVSENKDYSTRAIKHANDEIGQLIDAFNEMLVEIQQRDGELLNVNERLEFRVKEKTADLIIVNKQLEQLNMELKATVSKLTSANKELSDFAHVAAHDLKAPLRAIGSLAGIIAEDYADKLDEQGKKHFDLLVKRTERMSELINGILRYSELGKVVNEKEKVDLNKVVTDVTASLDPPKNIEVTVENTLPVIVAEKTRMAQIFQNLLSNAIKYMDKPNGLIQIGCSVEEGFWKFYVKDNGPGIDAKYYDKIFVIFQTLTRRDEIESTGIGLSMVKKIVEELYAGKVWVESTVGLGSTFFFTLPIQESEVEYNEELQTNIAG